jgi:hypothetical protein
MSLMTRTALSMVAIGLVLTACSTTESGVAQPKADGTATTATSRSEPSTSSPSKSTGSPGTTNAFANAKPCSLVSQVDIGQLQLTDIKELDQEGCELRYPDRVRLRINKYLDKGLKDYVLGSNSEPSDMTIGTRKSKLVKKPVSDMSCAVAIPVTDSSRLDVVATSPADLQKSCDAAMKVATAVEPKLP